MANELSSRNAHAIDGESAGGFIERVAVAEFQADSYMAGEIKNRRAVMAITKDNDIPIVAVDCCLAISEFTKTNIKWLAFLSRL